MTIVIDLIRKNNEHHVFNFETVSSICYWEPDSVFYLDSNSSSIGAVKNHEKIKYLEVKQGKRYFWIISILWLVKILLSNIKDKQRVVLLSATPLMYMVCSLLSYCLRFDVLIFMHGELGYISSSHGVGKKIGKFLLLGALKLKTKVKFIAINEYIFNCLKSRFKKANFDFVEHPLQAIDVRVTRLEVDSIHSNFLTVGSFGIHSREKNSHLIYSLAEKIDFNRYPDVRLVTIGVSSGSFDYDVNSHVNHSCRGHLNTSLIPKDELFDKVKNLDFAIFFNGMDSSYDLVPSGIFADCIALELPIISLKNKKMEFFFNKYGKGGLLCEDVSDMANVIMHLSQCPEEIKKYKQAMLQIKDQFSSEHYRESIYRVLYG